MIATDGATWGNRTPGPIHYPPDTRASVMVRNRVVLQPIPCRGVRSRAQQSGANCGRLHQEGGGSCGRTTDGRTGNRLTMFDVRSIGPDFHGQITGGDQGLWFWQGPLPLVLHVTHA